MIPGVGRTPGEENGYPLQCSIHGQRSLAGYSLWGHKESDMSELLSQTSRPICHGLCLQSIVRMQPLLVPSITTVVSSESVHYALVSLGHPGVPAV